jgi:Skp family chaperone for outer membrane proteins
MKRSDLGKFGWLGVLLLFVGWLIGNVAPQSNLRAAPEAQAVSRDTKPTAVLDVFRAVHAHSKYITGKAAWEETWSRYTESRAKEVAEWTKMRDELKTLPEESDEALALQRKLERLGTDIADRDKRMNKESDNRRAQLIAISYEDLAVAAEAVRKKSGYAIVLSYYSQPIDPTDLNDVLWHAHRQIVTFDRSVDITDQVIEQMKN